MHKGSCPLCQLSSLVSFPIRDARVIFENVNLLMIKVFRLWIDVDNAEAKLPLPVIFDVRKCTVGLIAKPSNREGDVIRAVEADNVALFNSMDVTKNQIAQRLLAC